MTQTTIISGGELLVEFVSHRRDCALRVLGEYSGPYPSGAPAIVIDQAARMGVPAHIFGSLGTDNFGSALIERLESNGVVTSAISRLSGKTTGVAFVSYYTDGSRTFIFHLENTAADTITEATLNIPEGRVILHVSGSSLGNPKLRGAIEKLVSKVLAQKGQISCDPNARKELMDDTVTRDALDRIIRKSTYLFPSTSDLEFLFPDLSEQDVVAHLHSYEAEIVAVKRGAEGATIFDKERTITFPGHDVDEVDPTGAGDCFCGTFLAMIAQGNSMETAGRYANAAGALAVMQRGPMEGNSDVEAIERFLASSTNTAIETA